MDSSLNMHFYSLLQAQIDGNVVGARFTLPRREKVSPPKAAAPPPKRDVSKTDGADAEKDGPKRMREGKSHEFCSECSAVMLEGHSHTFYACSFSTSKEIPCCS